MAKLFEKYPPSDHIRTAAFPAAKEKGELCIFGILAGIADYAAAQGAPGSLDIGKDAAVFQAAAGDVAGTLSIGTGVYLTSAGALTASAAGNTLFGAVTAANPETVEIARM